MYVIGLIGAIGSGKSAAAAILERRGALRLDCDAIVHELYEDPAVADAVAQAFGDDVRGPGGIDRVVLNRKALASWDTMRRLTDIMHPLVASMVRRRLHAHEVADGRLAVIEAAFLVESGLVKLCDSVWLIESGEEQRKERLERNRGWPAGEAERRERYQMLLRDKRVAADVIINNDSDIEALARAIDELLGEIPEFSNNHLPQ